MIAPMAAMVALTFVVGGFTFAARMRALRTRQLPPGYFKLMQGDDVPQAVTKTARHFSNLFEVPVLFYAAGALYVATNTASAVAVAMAWLFVLARCAHAAIHLGYNHPWHRFAAFMAGNVFLLILWIDLVIRAAG